MALKARLCVGVTGHRHDNPLFAAHRDRIEATLGRVLDEIGTALAEEAQPDHSLILYRDDGAGGTVAQAAQDVQIMYPARQARRGVGAGTVETLAFAAAFFDSILSPIAAMAFAFGPMKTMPAASSAFAKASRSDRKP